MLLVSLVLLCLVFNMDAVIRQAVRDELRTQNQTQSDTGNQNVESTASTSSNQRTERTETRLSHLLDRIRKQPKGKKGKIHDKENRIQMQWIHFNDKSKVFVPVRTSEKRRRKSFYLLQCVRASNRGRDKTKGKCIVFS